MQRLSPLTRSSLFLTALLDSESEAQRKHPASSNAIKRSGPIRVYVWECEECGDRHDYEDEAAECCALVDAEGEPTEEGFQCPVCRRGGNRDNHEAANCCLWKDLDAPARWRIADAVDAGASWTDAIAEETE